MNFEIPQRKYNNLTREEQRALDNLKNDKNVVIESADNGSVVVVLDRDDYISPLSQLEFMCYMKLRLR